MRLFSRYRRIHKSSIIIFISSLFVITFNEYISYELCSLRWSINYFWKIPSNFDDIKVLFVADPQLIGLEYEKRSFADVIRWDADRFISQGFSRALRYTDADIVVFLGDIFDEGEVASASEFQTYLERFNQIFTNEMSDKTKVIIIPGDNDVGGEGARAKSEFLVDRFIKVFSNEYPYIETLGNVNFIASDVWSPVDYARLKIFLAARPSDLEDKHNILLNHNSFVINKEHMVDLRISTIISAHTHLSKYQKCKDCSSIFTQGGTFLNNYTHIQFNLSTTPSDIFEITVPTCSYRMGVPYPGYGYMTITKDGAASYMVLWLPYRFISLFLYLLMLIVLIVFVLVKCVRYF